MNNQRDDDYLISHIDRDISELVIPHYRLAGFYNYYNGIRNADLFRYLEENYGIGQPTSVLFTPLIRKHIDALIGEYLDVPVLPKVSCKDKDTISKITRDRELEITRGVFDFFKSKLNNKLMAFIEGKPTPDQSILLALDKLIADINDNFTSNYEIAALNVVEYILQSRSTDLHNKLKLLLLDLLVTGYTYYKVGSSSSETNIEIETLSPLNVFPDKNPNSVYVKDSYRIVVRRWMTKQEILAKYGSKLSKEAAEELESMYESYKESGYMYVRSMNNTATGASVMDGIDSGKGVVPGFPQEYSNSYSAKLLPVYEDEWLETDKEKGEYITNRYSGARIGASVYVLNGKDDNVVRSKDNPAYCSLSISGLYFTNRSGLPYSLVGACMNLQDKFDLINFFKDNVIANSGTAGDFVDVSMLPVALGTDLTDRLIKFLAYKKAGMAPIDSSLDGRGGSAPNTIFAGYDDTLKLNTMQAFDMALLRIEDTCSSITGVFRERLNGILQHDAVSNVLVGILNSYTVTKQYHLQMDTLTVDIILDCLNLAKRVWKNGLTGTIILGDKYSKVFTALPEHFTLTDYDIHIISSSQIMKEILVVQLLVMKFIESGGLDADILIEAMTSKSLTDLKSKVSKAFKMRKLENDQMGQMNQLLELAQLLLLQLQSLNQLLVLKIEKLDETKIQLEKNRLDTEMELRWYLAKTERSSKESTAKNDNKRTEIEYALLFDNNPYNDQIKLV